MANFNTVINSEIPVIVDFYAEWCAPCKMMPPILNEVKQKLGDKVRIIKINVDKNPVIAKKYNIMSIPTLMIFKNGAKQWQHVGVTAVNEMISQSKNILTQ